MARTYATIDAGIWGDPEFCALSAGAQRTYFMLITQTDITACGSLALTLRRWAKTCSENDLDVWLVELSDARFVLIDEDTEELLVRTFVKWDGGYKHAKRVLAVIANAKALRSHPLRTSVIAELAKLGVSIATPVPMDRQSNPTPEASDSRRSVVTEGEYVSTPETTSQEREPSPLRDDPSSAYCPKHQPNGTDENCGPCAGRGKRLIRAEAERKRIAEEAIRDAAARRAACTLCDDLGMVLDPDTSAPLRRCTDHDDRRTA